MDTKDLLQLIDDKFKLVRLVPHHSLQIILASKTLSPTVLKSRGLGVPMSSRAGRTAALLSKRLYTIL